MLAIVKRVMDYDQSNDNDVDRLAEVAQRLYDAAIVMMSAGIKGDDQLDQIEDAKYKLNLALKFAEETNDSDSQNV